MLPLRVRVCLKIPSGSTIIPFSPGEYSASDSPELEDGHSFPGLPEVSVDPTMLAMTSGYSMSDEDFFHLERRILATPVVEVSCKRVKTDG